VIASYLADKHSLGQAEEGWQLVEKLYQGKDKGQFFEQLNGVLKQTGYVAAGSDMPGGVEQPTTQEAEEKSDQ
jgi:hypothetical protein